MFGLIVISERFSAFQHALPSARVESEPADSEEGQPGGGCDSAGVVGTAAAGRARLLDPVSSRLHPTRGNVVLCFINSSDISGTFSKSDGWENSKPPAFGLVPAGFREPRVECVV